MSSKSACDQRGIRYLDDIIFITNNIMVLLVTFITIIIILLLFCDERRIILYDSWVHQHVTSTLDYKIVLTL
jgi:hypothetical protein